MTATDDVTMAAEAQAILDSADPVLPGMEAESKVSILGTTFSTDEQFVLGQYVEFRVTGYVTSAGDELIENEGRRHIIKVKTSMITVVDSDAEQTQDEAE